jgi:hypothetical protein
MGTSAADVNTLYIHIGGRKAAERPALSGGRDQAAGNGRPARDNILFALGNSAWRQSPVVLQKF